MIEWVQYEDKKDLTNNYLKGVYYSLPLAHEIYSLPISKLQSIELDEYSMYYVNPSSSPKLRSVDSQSNTPLHTPMNNQSNLLVSYHIDYLD